MKKSYIKINNETIPTPDEIDFEFRDIEGSSSGVTEAGITHRDIVRESVISISLKLTLTNQYLLKLSKMLKQNTISVKYFDPYSLEEKEISTYCTNFKVSLLNKNDSLGIWGVSFKLEEY
ncbi:hypothetical protein [uncultured Gemella sp.]|uniref:hypothetical protein n=1 Tax=uncultured Gemella sp. TaxID=254352 RepID=UPI00263375F9|nr:hypothetical protein [uncultured Gemella sp.]